VLANDLLIVVILLFEGLAIYVVDAYYDFAVVFEGKLTNGVVVHREKLVVYETTLVFEDNNVVIEVLMTYVTEMVYEIAEPGKIDFVQVVEVTF